MRTFRKKCDGKEEWGQNSGRLSDKSRRHKEVSVIRGRSLGCHTFLELWFFYSLYWCNDSREPDWENRIGSCLSYWELWKFSTEIQSYIGVNVQWPYPQRKAGHISGQWEGQGTAMCSALRHIWQWHVSFVDSYREKKVLCDKKYWK